MTRGMEKENGEKECETSSENSFLISQNLRIYNPGITININNIFSKYI